MSKRIILEHRSDGQLYDADGLYLATYVGIPKSFEPDRSVADVTISLVKQGLSAEDIVKLKNADLI